MNKILFGTVIPAAVLVFCVILSLCPIGCKASLDEIDVLEGDFSVPHVENFSVNGSRFLQMDFTKKISVENASAYDSEEETSFCDVHTTYSEDGKSAYLEMDRETVVGKKYVVEGIIVDEHGNSLTFSIPFRGYNENPAKIILSEVRNAYGTASVKDDSGTSQKVHRSEYVELYVLEEGNLSGIEVCSAGDGEEKKYFMPPINVKRGEYITVHMRTVDSEGFDGEGMISELEDNLNLSTHEDSCSSARDLWSDNTKACFADSDIIYLRNCYDGTILDALVYAKSSLSFWKDSYAEVVAAVDSSGVWGTEAFPENGVCSDFITTSAATRSFSRQNIEDCIAAYEKGEPVKNGKEVWMITANSGSGKKMIQGITPGFKNSSNEYRK
ncbi:hypothetical protein [Treponema sp.]|uniref:hypothetical protein n=1 Tax=Treponema sp. TaxID=166 RepID=UPI00298E75A9|nr:hypothetical protein [Treponema sp.]MCQ2240694.1 hypothetical protein [Treponema sp.]